MNRRREGFKFYCIVVLLTAIVISSYDQLAFAEDGEYGVVEQMEQQPIISVIVPLSLDFTIDPFEIDGKGQIYSNEQIVENHGDSDVLFMIKGASIEYASNTFFVPMPVPFKADLNDKEKKIYLELAVGENYIALTSDFVEMAPVMLNSVGSENSTFSMSVRGNVNPYSNAEWLDGDVSITLYYQIDTVQQEIWRTNMDVQIDVTEDVDIDEDVDENSEFPNENEPIEEEDGNSVSDEESENADLPSTAEKPETPEVTSSVETEAESEDAELPVTEETSLDELEKNKVEE